MNLNNNPTIDQLAQLFAVRKDSLDDHLLWVSQTGEVRLDRLPPNTVEDEFEEELGEMCFLAFIDTWEQEYWTLGTAFTKGYYSVFDNDDHANAKMGFIPTATSEKKVPT